MQTEGLVRSECFDTELHFKLFFIMLLSMSVLLACFFLPLILLLVSGSAFPEPTIAGSSSARQVGLAAASHHNHRRRRRSRLEMLKETERRNEMSDCGDMGNFITILWQPPSVE